MNRRNIYLSLRHTKEKLPFDGVSTIVSNIKSPRKDETKIVEINEPNAPEMSPRSKHFDKIIRRIPPRPPVSNKLTTKINQFLIKI